MAKALKERLAQKLEQQEVQEILSSAEPIETDNMMVQEPNGNIIHFNSKQESMPAVQVVPDFAITLNEARERIRILQEFVREMMREGLDYGMVPGCNKPTLLKPGAEKLCDIFGFSKRIEVVNRVEDWEKGIFHYEVKAILISKRTGVIEAEGIGSCNTKEKKYKNQDSYSITNTALKMAKKRALVDAVLSATRSSGIFTQDIEDFIAEPEPPRSERTSINSIQAINATATPVTKQQLTEIFTLVAQKAIPVDKMKTLLQERYGIHESKKLTSIQAEDLKAHLKALNA